MTTLAAPPVDGEANAALIAFVVARAMVPAISKNVEEGQVASGVFLGAIAIALGLLNAACMTY